MGHAAGLVSTSPSSTSSSATAAGLIKVPFKEKAIQVSYVNQATEVGTVV